MSEQEITLQEMQYTQREWVYTGIRFNSKRKKIYVWLDKSNPEQIHTFSKPIAWASIGAIYRVFLDQYMCVVDDGDFLPACIGRLDDEKQITLWATEDEAARKVLTGKSEKTKAAPGKTVDKMISEIQQMAGKMSGQEKRAFFNLLVQELFKPSRRDYEEQKADEGH